MFYATQTLAIVIDIQQRLVPAMLNSRTFVNKSCQMIKGLNILNIPVILTEQYPRGLGNTVADVQILSGEWVFEKTQFSALTPEVQI